MSETGYCLGVHCGITFAGLKPASLFWLKDGQDGDIVYYRSRFAKRDFRFLAVRRSAAAAIGRCTARWRSAKNCLNGTSAARGAYAKRWTAALRSKRYSNSVDWRICAHLCKKTRA